MDSLFQNEQPAVMNIAVAYVIQKAQKNGAERRFD